MFRRSLLQISTRRLCHTRRSIPLPRQITSQGHSVRGFSTKQPQQNANVNGRGSAKIFFGSVAIGAASMALYSSGYLDPYLGKKPQVSVHSENEAQGGMGQELVKQSEASTNSGSDGDNNINSGFESADKSTDSLTDPPLSELSRKTNEEGNVSVHGGEELPFSNSSNGSPTAKPGYAHFDSSEKVIGMETLEENNEEEQLKGIENAPIISHATTISQDSGTEPQVEHPSTENKPEDVQIHEEDPPHSLLDDYNLKNVAEVKTAERPESGISSTEKAPETTQNMDDLYGPKDGNLILDFLQVIHTAEQRQSELDARIHSEEKRMMKEKYDKELKDARARELMYVEEVAMLEKGIKKEKAKAAAALKALRDNAEERLKMELELKEKEAESKLKEVQEFSKAELAAAIAREKAAQIENMAEANENIKELCMGYYARSEVARQTHSVHKLALGALALKDALSKGRPIQPEVVFIREYATTDVDKDLLLDLVLSSLPEEIQSRGTDTPLQLNQKFDDLKDTLRHCSLLPPDGGGILAHSLAYVASFLKVREADKSGNGIESIINRVQSLLAEGKVAEAADFLESGVQGSQALGVVGEWVKQARNRAISEQALMLLQSYTTCASLT